MNHFIYDCVEVIKFIYRKIEHLDLSGNEISLGGKASQITLFNNKRLKALLLSDNK